MHVSGAQPDELRNIFDELSDGANKKNFVVLREMPFGLCGRLTGRYGKEWFFGGEKAAASNKEALQLTTTKDAYLFTDPTIRNVKAIVSSMTRQR